MDVRELLRLDGKVAIVTGGYGYYGASISAGLAEMGAHVVVASRNGQKCSEFAESVNGRGLSAEGAQLDLGDDESIVSLIDSVKEKHGRIDILVNNAVTRTGLAELDNLTRDSLDGSAAVNIDGQILITKAVVPIMQANGGGSIINISSIRGLDSPQFPLYEPGQVMSVNYTIEKWALLGFTKWCACKYGCDKIRSNAICPAGYDPALRDSGHPYYYTYMKHSPLGRWAEGYEIKGPVVFLASEASSYVNGATLVMDGGWTIW